VAPEIFSSIAAAQPELARIKGCRVVRFIQAFYFGSVVRP